MDKKYYACIVMRKTLKEDKVTDSAFNPEMTYQDIIKLVARKLLLLPFDRDKECLIIDIIDGCAPLPINIFNVLEYSGVVIKFHGSKSDIDIVDKLEEDIVNEYKSLKFGAYGKFEN